MTGLISKSVSAALYADPQATLSPKDGARWYRKGADDGFPNAQYRLGTSRLKILGLVLGIGFGIRFRFGFVFEFGFGSRLVLGLVIEVLG